MTKSFANMAAVITVCLFASTVHADLVLGLSFDDSTTSKTVTSGSSVFVDMFLTDTDASTPMSARGLISGGGRIDAAGTATVGYVGTTAAAGWDAGTTASPVFAVPGVASVLLTPPVTMFPPFLSPVGIGATTIQLARFEFMISGAAGETTTFSPDVLGGIFNGNEVALIDFFDPFETPVNLDTLLTGTSSVDVTIAAAAVPEASTLLFGTLLAAGFVYRKRKTRVTEVIS